MARTPGHRLSAANLPDEAASSSAERQLLGQVERVPIDRPVLSERNPRRGDVSAICESLKINGQFRPLVVRASTWEVLAGNHTLRAALELGWKEISVCRITVTDEQARRILLADNRTADLAGYDSLALSALLRELDGDFGGTGYTEDDLDALLDELCADAPLEDDAIPPLPAQPASRIGDVYTLGDSRLVCGDATDPAVSKRLMADELAEMLVTDPPYGVAYEGKTAARMRLPNDEPRGLARLLRAAFGVADAALAPGAPAYSFCPAGALGGVFMGAYCERWDLRQQVIWVKDSMVVGHSDYHYRHEPILFGYKPRPDGGRLGRGGDGWFGGNRQTSVLEVARPRASREHPTAKPPELVAQLVRNSSKRGSLVLDPFAGSGSTLVACERLGRRARLVELDPGFCDVIVARWERLTGRRAEREEG